MILLCDVSGEDVGKPKNYYARFISYKMSVRFSVWLFSLGVAFGQQIDTTAYHELSGVEVVEKVRPSVTREGTPLQIMDRAGIDRLGVQDLSEAVKRFSGVTVQDYGGSED